MRRVRAKGKRAAQVLAGPFLRYFDRRFREVHEQLLDRQEKLSGQVEGVRNSVVHHVDEARADLARDVEQVPSRIASEVARRVDTAQAQVRDDVAIMSELALVVERFTDRFGLRVDELITRIHALGDPGGEQIETPVALRTLDAQIVEIPFAHAVAAHLPAGASVLVAGSAASPLPLSLASLGFEVTAVDRHACSFEHPGLRVVTGVIEDWEGPRSPFTAIFSGTASDGPDTDRVLERFREWLVPGGELVISVPYLDGERLAKLVADWDVREQRLYVRSDPSAWKPYVDSEDQQWEPDRSGLALLRLSPRS